MSSLGRTTRSRRAAAPAAARLRVTPSVASSAVLAPRLGALQRAVGNQAVLQRLTTAASSPAEVALETQRRTDQIAVHRANQQRVYGYVRDAAAAPAGAAMGKQAILRNTCQLILQNVVQLHVLSPTHDSQARTGAPAQMALFDKAVAHDTEGGTYPLEAGDGDNIFRADAVEDGRAVPPKKLYIFVKPGSTEDAIKETIVHETQHLIDPPAAGGILGPSAFETYKTEFRAYYLQAVQENGQNSWGSPFERAVNADFQPVGHLLGVATNFRNRMQERIFLHIAGSGAYPNVTTQYMNSAAFRAKVEAYATPASVNLINSQRVWGARQSYLTLDKGFFAELAKPVKFAAYGAPGWQNGTVADLLAAQAANAQQQYCTEARDDRLLGAYEVTTAIGDKLAVGKKVRVPAQGEGMRMVETIEDGPGDQRQYDLDDTEFANLRALRPDEAVVVKDASLYPGIDALKNKRTSLGYLRGWAALLDATDKAFLGKAMAAPFWNEAAEHLDAATYEELRRAAR